MQIRMGLVLAALLALAACATNDDYAANRTASNTAAPAAAPQRVNAVSDALGQRVDSMVASRRSSTTSVTQ